MDPHCGPPLWTPLVDPPCGPPSGPPVNFVENQFCVLLVELLALDGMDLVDFVENENRAQLVNTSIFLGQLHTAV